jgi:hypothetical protein
MVRKPLGSSAAAAGIAGSGAFLFMQAMAQDKVNINMQFGRIAGGQQIGEGWPGSWATSPPRAWTSPSRSRRSR